MKISAKGRYGLAATIYLAQNPTGNITILKISEALRISKIYLEQIFALLKRAQIVSSNKGPQGGYRLNHSPDDISVYDILSALELSLFEKTELICSEKKQDIEKAIHYLVFKPLDNVVELKLKEVTLSKLVQEAQKYDAEKNYMFYI